MQGDGYTIDAQIKITDTIVGTAAPGSPVILDTRELQRSGIECIEVPNSITSPFGRFIVLRVGA
jgi:hypothetical protein